MPTATISEQPGLKRLVLIDAQNLIHCFTRFFRFQSGESLNPAVLLLLAYDLTNRGFNVRVIARRQAVEPKHVFDLPFIFDMLEKCKVMMTPSMSNLESDDRMMLDMAKKHGAVIVTNDKMMNHQKRMQMDLTKHIVGFTAARNPEHETCNFLERLEGLLKVEFSKPDSFFYCKEGEEDYDAVLKSQKDYVLYYRNRQYLMFSELYLRCYVGFCYDCQYQNKMLPSIRELVFGNDWCVKNIKYYFADVTQLVTNHNTNRKKSNGDVAINMLIQSFEAMNSSNALRN